MKRSVAWIVFAIAAGFLAPATRAAEPIRIMPLGDSITAGSYGAGKNGIGGYRAPLATACADAGMAVNLVGSLNDPAGANFDADHEGHRAWRADSLADNITAWLQASRPDIVLAQAGVNDLIQGATPEVVVQRITVLLQRAFAAAPEAHVYLAGILAVRNGNDYHVSAQAVAAVNAQLPALVKPLRDRGMHVEYIDLSERAAVTSGDFSADGLHPNDAGYAKMGRAWFDVIRADLRGLGASRDSILYGAAYYTEYMPVERLEQDVALMRDAGLNVVRIAESTWGVMEPKDGVFDFSTVDRVLDAMHGAGIHVIVGMPTYSVPTWLAREHPEVLLNGWESYGYRQNMDISNPTFRRYAERIVRALVTHVRAHPAVIGFQIDNETKSYGAATAGAKAAFVDFLHQRFPSLAEMNRAWGLNYWGQDVNAWEDFPNPAAASNPGLKLEWNRFQRRMATDFLAWEAGVVRGLKRPDQFITHNFDLDHDAPNWQVDHFEAAKAMDVAGIDVYYPAQHAFNGAGIAFAGDYARSFLRKNHLVLETTAQTCGWDSKYQFPPLDGQVRQAFYSHLASGANMVEYWHWHSLHFGQETYWRGVLGQDLEPNRVYREIKQTGLEMRRFANQLCDLRVRNQVAILYSGDSQNALRLQPFSDTADYGTVLRQLYDTLFRMNVGVDFVVPESDFSRYAVLVVPPLYIADDALCAKLSAFARAGGRVVFSFKAAFCDENSQVRHVRAPGPLADICGVTYQEFSTIASIPLAAGSLVPDGQTASANTWLEFLQCKTAKPLIEYQDAFFGRYPAVTDNQAGAGEVIYQGTLLPDAVQERVFRYVLDRAHIAEPEQGYHFPVIVRGGVNVLQQQVRYVFNYSEAPVTVTSQFPAATDLVTDKTVANGASLTLPPWGVAILEWAAP